MIRPLFSFYGSKWRDAKRYPAPTNGHVVEPFAGSAGYSLWYEPANVSLFDVDPIIVGVWQYLIYSSRADILALPTLEPGASVDDLSLSQEARWLIGFWVNKGSAQPKKTMTDWPARYGKESSFWGPEIRMRIADDVHRVSHWKITQASYADAVEIDATYFVDPPYVEKGKHYRYWDVDYAHLGTWVRALRSQAIVCEQAGATWLPFVAHGNPKNTPRPDMSSYSAEVVYRQGAWNDRLFDT